MSECFISNQIAVHCDDDEVLCDDCGHTMTFSDNDLLVCDNIENCSNYIDTNPDLN